MCRFIVSHSSRWHYMFISNLFYVAPLISSRVYKEQCPFLGLAIFFLVICFLKRIDEIPRDFETLSVALCVIWDLFFSVLIVLNFKFQMMTRGSGTWPWRVWRWTTHLKLIEVIQKLPWKTYLKLITFLYFFSQM